MKRRKGRSRAAWACVVAAAALWAAPPAGAQEGTGPSLTLRGASGPAFTFFEGARDSQATGMALGASAAMGLGPRWALMFHYDRLTAGGPVHRGVMTAGVAYRGRERFWKLSPLFYAGAGLVRVESFRLTAGLERPTPARGVSLGLHVSYQRLSQIQFGLPSDGHALIPALVLVYRVAGPGSR